MAASMKHLEKLSRKHLGEILVDEGLISKSQLADAEREQKQTGLALGAILVDSTHISEWDLAKIVSSQYQLPFLDLGGVGHSKAVAGLFSREEPKERRFYPLDRFGNILTLAVGEMPDIDFLKDVHERTTLVPFLYVALISEIEKKVEDLNAKTESTAAKKRAAKKPAPAPAPAPAEPETAPAPKPALQKSEAIAVLDEILPEEEVKPRPAPEKTAPEQAPAEAPSGGWENIFDSANESVLKEVDGE